MRSFSLGVLVGVLLLWMNSQMLVWHIGHRWYYKHSSLCVIDETGNTDGIVESLSVRFARIGWVEESGATPYPPW